MLQRLRQLLTSVPSITVVGLLSAYLLVGFFVLPAVLAWQLEKQLVERGHALQVAAVRFDPLRLTLEVDDLSVADGQGEPMLGVDHLMVDLQWRSVVDRAWTIADVRLLGPRVRFERGRDGKHNFSDLLAQFASDEPEAGQQDDASVLPPLRLHQLHLWNGQVEWLDRLLEQPLVSRIVPLHVHLADLSTLADAPGRYRVSARTEAGESLEMHGTVAIGSGQASGELALQGLQVATLARGLNRELALQSPRGRIELGGRFEGAIGADGRLAGGARAMQLAVTDLFLQPPGGGAAPLLAMQTLALNAGRFDVARRELHVESVRLADASAHADIDAQGVGSWQGVMREVDVASASPAVAASASAQTAATVSTPPAVPLAVPSGAAEPWAVTIGDLRIDRLALGVRDALGQRGVMVSALGLGTAVDLQLGGSDGARLRLPQLRLTADGLMLEQAGATVSAPSARIDAAAVELLADGDAAGATLGSLVLVLAQGMAARNGGDSASLAASELALAGMRARSGGNGVRIEIDKPQWQASTLLADGQGQNARIGQLAFGGTRLLLESGAAASGGQGSGSSGIGLALAGLSLQLDALSATTGQGGPASATGQSAEMAQLSLQAQRLALDLTGDGNTLSLDTLRSTARDLQWQSSGQVVPLGSAALDNTRLELRQGSDGAQLQVDALAARLGGLAARRGTESAELAELALQGSRIDMRSADNGTTEFAFTGMQAAGSQLVMARPAESVQVASLALASEQMQWALGTDSARFSGSGANAALAGLQATQEGRRLTLQDARWKAQTFDGSGTMAADGPSRASARIDGNALSLASLVLRRAGAQGLATLDTATWSAGSLALDMDGGPLQLRGDAMVIALGPTALNDPSGQPAELVRLGEIDVSGAAFSLADQSVTADVLRVRDLRGSAWLDAHGRLNLLDVLGAAGRDSAAGGAAGGAAPVAATAAITSPAPAGRQTAQTAPSPESATTVDASWHIAVKSVDLQDTSLRFEDRRRDPPLALGLDAVTLALAGLDTAAGAPAMQVTLGATLASGGLLQASGSAALEPQALDLQLSVAGLVLAPVQPLLSEYLDLTLASGTASTKGRLTYGAQPETPGQWVYTGGFAIDKILLEEVTPKRPFLAWESVRSDDLRLTLQPNAVDIGEVLLDQPVGRLIIAPDQSVNLADVLKDRREGADAADGGKAPATQAGVAGADDPFPVTVSRVKVRGGQLEFADLSLRPQFGTRMHALEGVVTGLGTDANRSAQVQLDARVDRFGSARIRGQLSLQQPERLTDIDMAFRNLDMSALSPYVVKFAGYEIESGQLSLDLQYKVRDGRLQGENKLVLTKAELGRKVESPGALDLPLDLALAILKDSNGVIDIGVPVRGDLNDPQFDYGAVIAKAIGNLIGGIVTAPFRALAAMFGGGDKPIDTIQFEPGMATLAPPEQQKIETVARALAERPALVLKVAPVVAPEQDTPVLQSLAVRSEIALRMGLKLEANEDPGPIDAANPRVPAAVKAAFSARYAPAVFEALAQRAVEQAGEGAAGQGKTARGSAGQGAGQGKAASSPVAQGTSVPTRRTAQTPPPAFYQGLIERMISEQAVSQEELAQLATRRAEAVVAAVTGENGGVPSDRVQTGTLRRITDATRGMVPLRLELDVAK